MGRGRRRGRGEGGGWVKISYIYEFYRTPDHLGKYSGGNTRSNYVKNITTILTFRGKVLRLTITDSFPSIARVNSQTRREYFHPITMLDRLF